MDRVHLERIGLRMLRWEPPHSDAAPAPEAAAAADASVGDSVGVGVGAAADALEEQEDEEVLFEMDAGLGITISVPCSIRNDFFEANFAVTSLAPHFSVELSPLGPGGAGVGHDVCVQSLDATAAHRIAAALRRLDDVPLRDFLQARAGAGLKARDVPSVVALTEVFQAAAGCGARPALAPGLADPKEAVCCYFDTLCDLLRPTPEAFLSVVDVVEVMPSIFCIETASSFVLGKMFLRLQEYYECPDARFRRQRFTLEEYKAWCRDPDASGEGGFRYYVTWPGFNLPSWVVDDARDGALGPLEPWEEALLEVVKGAPAPFYVIGTSDKDPLTLRHELAHGLYATNPEYKLAVTAVLERLSDTEREGLRHRLLEMGYVDDGEIIADETQAYMCEGNCLGCGRSDLLTDLAAVFDRFGGGHAVLA